MHIFHIHTFTSGHGAFNFSGNSRIIDRKLPVFDLHGVVAADLHNTFPSVIKRVGLAEFDDGANAVAVIRAMRTATDTNAYENHQHNNDRHGNDQFEQREALFV